MPRARSAAARQAPRRRPSFRCRSARTKLVGRERVGTATRVGRVSDARSGRFGRAAPSGVPIAPPGVEKNHPPPARIVARNRASAQDVKCNNFATIRPQPSGRLCRLAHRAPLGSRDGALGELRLLRDADRLERRDPRRAGARVRRRRRPTRKLAALPRARARARARRQADLPRGDDRGDAPARRAGRRGARAGRLAPDLAAVPRGARRARRSCAAAAGGSAS